MTKVRINDLARELEVKSKPILDALEAIGVSGKTHSSSIDPGQAERVREYFKNGGRSSAVKPAVATAKPAFNLSGVSKPGDALKAILERRNADAAAKAAPPQRGPAVVVPAPSTHIALPVTGTRVAAVSAPVSPSPASATSQPTSAVTSAAAPAVPRRVVPLPRQGANIVAQPPVAAPAIASKLPTGPVVVARPANAGTATASSSAQPLSARPVVAVAVPPAAVAKPVVAVPATVTPAAVSAVPAASTPVASASSIAELKPVPTAAPGPVPAQAEPTPAADVSVPAEEAASAPAAAAPRRVIMPQTGHVPSTPHQLRYRAHRSADVLSSNALALVALAAVRALTPDNVPA